MGRSLRGSWVVGGLIVVGCVMSACADDSRRSRAGRAERGEGTPETPGAGGRSGGKTPDGMTGGGGRGASPDVLPPPASSLAPGSLCDRGWCWYSPLPSDSDWAAVAGAGRTDLWVGGFGFTHNLLHFDGGRWNVHQAPLTITGIWGASEDDVWFIGELEELADVPAAIAHWDGVALTVTETFPGELMQDVWGSGPDDVYAASGVLRHWDGASWTVVPDIFASRVDGTGRNDVWVTSGSGMFHFDGSGWSRVPQFDDASIFELSVAPSGDVWTIIGRTGPAVVERFDGVSSTVVSPTRSPDIFLSAIQAVSDNDVWLVGVRPPGGLSNISPGAVFHFDGSSWSPELVASAGLRRVERTSGLGVVAVGPNGALVRLVADPAPHIIDLRVGPTVELRSTFGSSPADMWAVGDAGTVVHYDGHNLASVASGTTADLRDVWGTGPSDVWVVGTQGTLLHYDGRAFTSMSSGTDVDLRAVFTADPGDVWIAGDAGVLRRGGSGGFGDVVVPGVSGLPIRDLHGLASDDVWLAGGTSMFTQTGPMAGFWSGTGFVSHFDGTAWSPIQVLTFDPPSISEPIVRIWELAPNDVWALTALTLQSPAFAGTGRWHFDGATWTGTQARDVPEAFMFPAESGSGTFVFGPHDRWRVGVGGLWQRNTQ